MEWLQTLLDGGTAPVLTALILGLMTAISPCPLATNIAAMGYIARDMGEPRRSLSRGFLYCIGRMLSYTVLGIVLISIIKGGSSAFGVQSFVAGWGEKIIGPLMLLVGLFMLFGNRLKLKGFGFSGDGSRLSSKGGWGALALGAGSIGRFYNRMASVQKWMNIAVGILFIGIGIYYSITILA